VALGGSLPLPGASKTEERKSCVKPPSVLQMPSGGMPLEPSSA